MRHLALLASLLLAPLSAAGAAEGKPLRILFFTKSSGYEHSVIKQVDGKPSHAETVLAGLAGPHRLDITTTKDGGVFTAERLAAFDLFLFYTTGDLCTAGKDGNPPMSPEGKAAFIDAVAKGKGFVGVHSSSDSFHSPGVREEVSAQLDPYVAMLGGEFIRHDAQQSARVTCHDPAFPGMAKHAAGFTLHEEWYSLKNFSTDLHVLQVLDTTGMKGLHYQRGPFPVTWARLHGQGRVFYTALGHREDVWTNPAFQDILLGGIDWAGGRIAAAVPGNLAEAAPRHAEMPPKAQPKSK